MSRVRDAHLDLTFTDIVLLAVRAHRDTLVQSWGAVGEDDDPLAPRRGPRRVRRPAGEASDQVVLFVDDDQRAALDELWRRAGAPNLTALLVQALRAEYRRDDART